jgi:hypothetical protein
MTSNDSVDAPVREQPVECEALDLDVPAAIVLVHKRRAPARRAQEHPNRRVTRGDRRLKALDVVVGRVLEETVVRVRVGLQRIDLRVGVARTEEQAHQPDVRAQVDHDSWWLRQVDGELSGAHSGKHEEVRVVGEHDSEAATLEGDVDSQRPSAMPAGANGLENAGGEELRPAPWIGAQGGEPCGQGELWAHRMTLPP